ncbi:hypothetical protein ACSBOB_14770 [Mesorhizobium sp. ASY16-5R]|uniref:hypothetical protein n=1 Tax=Mesorhizobium sp. ASY16-5R TaxID=3445772 RepID=UPI003F9F504B
MRFPCMVLETGGTSIIVKGVLDIDDAQRLLHDDEFLDDIAGATRNGVPVWDRVAALTWRPGSEEEGGWLERSVEHNNERYGLTSPSGGVFFPGIEPRANPALDDFMKSYERDALFL